MDRIVQAFATEKAHDQIARLLSSGGLSPYACCFSGADTIRMVRKLGDAVVICGFRLRDMTAPELAADLGPGTGVLVIASAANLDLCQGENLYRLPVPASRADLYASLDTLLHQRRRRPPPARQEEAQRLIRRAKELLMEVNRMSEAEAHRFLQKRSMDTGAKLADTARLVLEHYTV